MAFWAKNKTSSTLVFKSGYVNVPPNATVEVEAKDHYWGVFRDFVNQGLMEIVEVADQAVTAFDAVATEVQDGVQAVVDGVEHLVDDLLGVEFEPREKAGVEVEAKTPKKKSKKSESETDPPASTD